VRGARAPSASAVADAPSGAGAQSATARCQVPPSSHWPLAATRGGGSADSMAAAPQKADRARRRRGSAPSTRGISRRRLRIGQRQNTDQSRTRND
jgi:hypothetical protein